MLKLFHSTRGLDKAQLQSIYDESIRCTGKQNYSYLPENLQYLRAEEDFYGYVDLFLSDKNSVYAVWDTGDAYCAALRIEPYKDGYLLSGLETASEKRHKGYATALVKGIQEYLEQTGPYKLYSHVDKGNYPSLLVHERCGFVRLLSHAVYVDGSVSHDACTLCYTK